MFARIQDRFFGGASGSRVENSSGEQAAATGAASAMGGPAPIESGGQARSGSVLGHGLHSATPTPFAGGMATSDPFGKRPEPMTPDEAALELENDPAAILAGRHPVVVDSGAIAAQRGIEPVASVTPVGASTPTTAPAATGSLRLHERLAAFRESAFDENSLAASASGSPPAHTTAAGSPTMPVAGAPTLAAPALAAPIVAAPAGASPVTTGLGASTAPSSNPVPMPILPNTALTQPPAVASLVTPGLGLSGGVLAPLPGMSQPAATPPVGASGSLTVGSSAVTAASVDERVLFTRQSPSLTVDTLGPRKIIVGHESAYEVVVRNSGQVAADQVSVNIKIPVWADVLGAEASTGSTSTAVPSGELQEFRWKVGAIEGGGSQKLVLRIVPRQSKPFDLAVTWDYMPNASQTVIEVQEPKLEMQLEGPREVLYGERHVFRLHLANTGSGDAEDVKLILMPIGGGSNAPATQPIGMLAAGAKKTVEVELTARETGTLTIQVEAIGEGGLRAQLAENILVQRAALAAKVEMLGAPFVGTQATYRVIVSNTGTAAAKKVEVKVALPAGIEFAQGGAGAQLSTDKREVTWTLDSLEAGLESPLEMVCNLTKAGNGRLEVSARADGDLATATGADVTIEGMADLQLAVADPSGPVALGVEASYQIEIYNRGSKSAENVEVFGYFADGIEPVSAEGGRFRLGNGEIVFDALPALLPGQKTTLKIKARADKPGSHVFRAEVCSKPANIRLVSEATTLYYASSISSQAADAPVSPSATSTSATPMPVAGAAPYVAPPMGVPGATAPNFARALAEQAASPDAALVGDRYARRPAVPAATAPIAR